MKKESVEKIINNACKILYQENKNLIDEKANERTIVNEMLPYLKKYFTNYEVWSEYNREGETESRQPKTDPDGKIIVPDIIIHKYGPAGRNLVAIEVKGYWNNKPRKDDEKKLKNLQLKYQYEFLYRIELGKYSAEVIDVSNT